MINKELYDELLKKRGIKTDKAEVTEKDYEITEYDLSDGQKGMWFLQQMEPDNPVYNNPSAMKLNGKVDIDALNKTMMLIVKEYETLRTGFKTVAGVPKQFLKDNVDHKVKVIDVRGYDEKTVELKLNELAKKPFSLEKDDLFRVYLLVESDEVSYLLINIHHIISDGWSKNILLKKMSDIYNTIKSGKEWSVSNDRSHYYDYVRRQSQWLASDQGKKALEYWKELLADKPAELCLAPDKNRNSIHMGKGCIKKFDVRQDVSLKVKELCRKELITPFLFFVSVMNVYLYKYTSQKDIVIGTPVAGRNMQEYEDVSGLFVNSIVLRNRIDETLPFIEYAKSVKMNAIKAFKNQNVPFSEVVKSTNPVRELNYSPLFQVMMQFDDSIVDNVCLGDIELKPMMLDTGASQVDLSVSFWEEDEQIKGSFEWNSSLFDDERAEDMICNFNCLLERIVERPDSQLSSYKVLSDEQYKKMVYDWNDTSYELIEDNVIEQFERVASERKNEKAVLYGDNSISYTELLKRTNSMAYALKNAGVYKDRHVVICNDKSIDFIIAVYSVIKAGGIVVPIDSTYPEKRIHYIIDSLNDPLIIAGTKEALKLVYYKERILSFEHLSTGDGSDDFCNAEVKGNDTLCIIFTSGSTGIPKGVELSYDCIKNLVWSFVRSYDATCDDSIMSISGIASASFIGEIFPAISIGAKLVLPDMNMILNVDRLIDYMEKNRVTILSTVPSMIGRLNSERLPVSVRIILSGGEALLSSHIDNMKNVKIANGYGLTESGICNTYKLSEVETLNDGIIANVGKPVINNKVYVLDGDMNPVPPYVLGEICVGGLSLASGYYNHKELTEKRFYKDPFSDGLVLRTGDIGYFLPDGDLIFVGRKDRQVQIRGFRIELGEIEKALESFAGIKEAAAVHIEEDESIAVYYTVHNDAKITYNQVIHWLKTQVPNYMIPRYCILIDEMPYNQNGKIDYKSLPSVEGMVNKHSVLKVQPRSNTEKLIMNIWKEKISGVDIGIDDNFFDVGGHSLLLSEVYNDLQPKIDQKLEIVDLFRCPTVRQLAAFIDRTHDNREDEAARKRGLNQRNAFSALKRIRK